MSGLLAQYQLMLNSSAAPLQPVMRCTEVQSSNYPGGEAISIPLPMSVTAGERLIVAFKCPSAVTTMKTPAGWTLLIKQLDSAGGGTSIWVFTKIAAGDETSFAANWSASLDAYFAQAFAVSGGSDVVAAGSNGSNTASPSVIQANSSAWGDDGIYEIFVGSNYYARTVTVWPLPANRYSNQRGNGNSCLFATSDWISDGSAAPASLGYTLSAVDYSANVAIKVRAAAR